MVVKAEKGFIRRMRVLFLNKWTGFLLLEICNTLLVRDTHVHKDPPEVPVAAPEPGLG
jgi:hypothetical protein